MVSDACPETEECFPGCYCPDGYIRSGEQCIKPTECRDCKCKKKIFSTVPRFSF